MSHGFLRRCKGWLDDRVHPIVLKELRQATQGRFLTGMLLSLVLVQLGAVGLFLLNQDLDSAAMLSHGGVGDDLFTILAVLLHFLVCLCLPIYVAVRFAAERHGEDLALLLISTLSPGRIIWGKIVSSNILGALMISACLPYMALTYFLRGVDLRSMGWTLGVIAVCMAGSVQLAILTASFPVKGLSRILVMSCGFLLHLWWFFVAMFYALEGGRAEFFLPSIWIGQVATVLACLGLLYFVSTALISPQASNRARGLRLYLTALWVVGGLGATVLLIRLGDDVPMRLWSVFSIATFSVCTLVATGAPDRISRRLRDELGASKWPRGLTFLYSSGAASGILWSALGVMLTVGWARLAGFRFSSSDDLWRHEMASFAAFWVAYSLLAIALQRGILRRWVKREYTFLVVAAVVTLACVVPPLISFFSFLEDTDFGLAGYGLVLNPFTVFHDSVGSIAINIGTLIALLMLAIQWRWIRAQWVDFRTSRAALDDATVPLQEIRPTKPDDGAAS